MKKFAIYPFKLPIRSFPNPLVSTNRKGRKERKVLRISWRPLRSLR
jgi:hypothetical protein